jgi:hypothetical protein
MASSQKFRPPSHEAGLKENIKTSAKDSLGLHDLKQHKPMFNEE